MSKRSLQSFAAELKVTTFLDYRAYLQELYDRAKAATSPYSYLLFAQDLGFAPSNMIRLVVARKRQLADKTAQAIVKALDLRKADRRYFLALVKHSNARSPAARDRHFQEMLAAKQEAIAATPDSRRMLFFSEWYYPVVRELLRVDGISLDPAVLAARLFPAVSADKIAAAIALLRTIADDGPILLPEDATAGELSITRYHQAMLDVAKDAVAAVPHGQRDFNALTVALSVENFQKLRDLARVLCAESLTLEAKPQTRDCVAQLNLQLFKLTKAS